MLLITIFCFFVFSTLALGLIFLSQLYLRMNGWRNHSLQMDYASENGIKAAFSEVMGTLHALPLPQVILDEDYEMLKRSLTNAQTRLLEEALGLHLPLEIHETEGNLEWSSQIETLLRGLEEGPTFCIAHLGLTIHSQGRIKGLSPLRKSSLDSQMDILVGNIPLFSFPFLVNKTFSPEERANFLTANEIEISSSTRDLISPQANFFDQPLIPQEADRLVEKAMNIKIFRPQDLSPRKLRQALGLEESDAPVPEGVYLLQNDLGLGGVYVQGNLQEMVFAIEEDFQVISFRMENGSWLLKFSPSRSETYFGSPPKHLFFSFIPVGIIIINGKVESLGGGVVDPNGEVVLAKDAEIPSLLQGVNLTLVASEKITITSHLIRQGISWREGIPYLKETSGQLIIFSTGQDLWADEAREGGITIGADSPSQMKLHASIVARGEGVLIEGKNKTIELVGSLQTTEYISSGTALKIFYHKPAEMAQSAEIAPLTQSRVLHLTRFEIEEWREF